MPMRSPPTKTFPVKAKIVPVKQTTIPAIVTTSPLSIKKLLTVWHNTIVFVNSRTESTLERRSTLKTMRLISLNTWCGRSLYPLMRFLSGVKRDIDIFCLQEVRNSDQETTDRRHPDEYMCGPLFGKISRELKEFNGFLASFEDDPHRMTLAMFLRKTLPIKEVKDFVVFKPKQISESGGMVFSPRKLQYAVLQCGEKELLVANYHGLWNAGPKTDTPERIDQSHRIKDFVDVFGGPKIICGDFNLLPETESMSVLEKGMQNLIKNYRVESTRTLLYRHYKNPSEPNFADYILASPDVYLLRFEVLPDMVSDHSPLFLEFEVGSVN